MDSKDYQGLIGLMLFSQPGGRMVLDLSGMDVIGDGQHSIDVAQDRVANTITITLVHKNEDGKWELAVQ